jgi:hypothetical protein
MAATSRPSLLRLDLAVGVNCGARMLQETCGLLVIYFGGVMSILHT